MDVGPIADLLGGQAVRPHCTRHLVTPPRRLVVLLLPRLTRGKSFQLHVGALHWLSADDVWITLRKVPSCCVHARGTLSA